MFQRLKNFIFQKQRQASVRLLPTSPSKGTVVLSYIAWPFREGHHSPKARGHTNAFEVVVMAQIYQELGFTVEVVDYNNQTYVPPRDCCVVIDIHGQLERWDAHLPKECLRILHATGPHWLTYNRSETDRLASLLERRQISLMPRRQVEPTRSVEFADHVTVLGNEYTMESFSFAKKPITRIPISSAYEFSWPEERNFSKAKKKFLWVGSFGMVQKGLDLVLEAFSKLPELSLTVCGRPEKESDFYQCYQKELLHTPNIHLHGWIDMASPEFQAIAQAHAAIIYPGAAEGGAGSVIHCMHAGMVPICTRETSVDLGDFGMLIKNGTVEAVMETARLFAALSDQEVQQRAETSYAHARKHHTREQFRENYSKFALNILTK
ncbi:MAG: glycosyltransferase [Chthoniobacterales bacterium]|nr:glycosyltransferase [Chthoniobacterales bacterium]